MTFRIRRLDSRCRFSSPIAFCLTLSLAGSLLLATIRAPAAAVSQETTTKVADDLDARLARLHQRIEAERKQQHIPGLALAIVKDDKLVFAKGFGYSDIDTKRPVTPDTVFAAGSTTKAFTTALIGMLVDDGKMSWDDPIEKHLPGLRLQVDTGEQQIAVRDLLCHRTGFTRMSILYAAGGLTRAEVLRLATAAKPYGDFRKQFLYNNLMYMAAGQAAGKAAHSEWDALIVERILNPLKMNHTTTSLHDVQQDASLAKGYLWLDGQQQLKQVPMRNLDLIGPAGSINSNIQDMAQWLRFQLGRGKFEGRQLLSRPVHAETWERQIQITPKMGYGLGWMLQQWNGKQVIEHGGNTDGFSAEVALLPEHNLGFVLLANVSATPLQAKSIDIVFRSLVGSKEDDRQVEQDRIDGLVGKYVANFGPFQDERFTVLAQQGKLAVDVPGQRVYELKAPDATGKWYFALTNQVAVSFKTDDDGQSVSLTMYQAGFEFECPREGVEIEAEVPLDELQPLLGTYRDLQKKINVKVIISNNNLAVDPPDGGLMALAAPDAEQKWALRANRQRFQLRFDKAADGSIVSMTRFERGKEFKMPRVAETPQDTIPTVDELIAKIRAAYRTDAATDIGRFQQAGTVDFVHQGGRGKITQTVGGVDRFRSDIDLGRLGYIRTVFDGQRGWSDSSFKPFEEHFGPRLQQLRFRHPLWLLQDWRGEFDSVTILRLVEVEGEQAYLLKLSADGLPTRTLAISADRSLVVMERTAEIVPGIGELPVKTTYHDYRPINGVMVPFKIVTETPNTGEIVMQFETANALETTSDDAFRLAPPENGSSN